MNKNLLLVIKWINNSESVSTEELKINSNSAHKLYSGGIVNPSLYAVYSACYAAYSAAIDGDNESFNYALRAVSKFFDLTGQNKDIYLEAIR